MTPRPNTIWIREYDDGDWEIGLLVKDDFLGWAMERERDLCSMFNLADWQFIGAL